MGPISELKLGAMGQHEVAWMQNYLKSIFNCSLTGADEGGYVVQFPSGSTEEANPEADPRYREDTLIKLPGKKVLRKVVKWPCTQVGCTHTFIVSPDEPLDVSRRK